MAKTTSPAKMEVRELQIPTMKASLQIIRHYNDNIDDDNIPVAVVVELVVAGEGELTSVTHGQGEEDLRSCRAPNLGTNKYSNINIFYNDNQYSHHSSSASPSPD